MAAVGILAALHERERSGAGQVVDISMTDGALSWLAMVIARFFCEREVPRSRRGRAGRRHPLLLPVRDARTAVGLARRARAEVLAQLVRRRRAPGPEGGAVRAPELGCRQEGRRRSSAERTRDEWTEFAGEHDCCLEPVLDLDEALAHRNTIARRMVVELDQPGIGPVRQAGSRSRSRARRPRSSGRRPRSAARRTRCSERSATTPTRIERAARRGGRVSTPPEQNGELLRMRELAEAAGVSAGTIKHYLREGLLRSRSRLPQHGLVPA